MPKKGFHFFENFIKQKIWREIFVKFHIKSFIKITKNKIIKFGYQKCKLKKNS